MLRSSNLLDVVTHLNANLNVNVGDLVGYLNASWGEWR
jgi:hypothetical protein